MTWDLDKSLMVVAADAPRRDAGAIAGRPVVRYGDGVYVIRRVDEDPPALLSPVSKDEFDHQLRSGAWMETPTWKAQRGYLTLATSGPFRDVLRRVPQAESRTRRCRFLWSRREDVELTYAHWTIVAEWMKAVATALLDYVEQDLFTARIDRAQLRSDLSQVMFLTTEQRKPKPAEAGNAEASREPRDGEGSRRLRMYLDFALLDREAIGDVSPGILSALRREFGYSDAEARDHVDRHWAELIRGKQIFAEMAPSSQRAAVFA